MSDGDDKIERNAMRIPPRAAELGRTEADIYLYINVRSAEYENGNKSKRLVLRTARGMLFRKQRLPGFPRTENSAASAR